MTTGRINQVRTIGGARARWVPHPGGRGWGRPHAGPLALRRWARGLSPVQAASDARARLPTPRRSGPRAGPGAELPMRCGPRERSLASPPPAPPSASARSRQLRTLGRISPCLRGARLGPGAELTMRCGPAGARSPAPGLRRPQPRPNSGSFGRSGASPHASEELASGRAGGRAAHAVWTCGRSLASPRPAPSSPGRTASPPPSGSHVRSAGASSRQAVVHPLVLSGCVLRLG